MIDKIIKGIVALLGTTVGWGIVALADKLGFLAYIDKTNYSLYFYVAFSLIFGIISLILSNKIIEFWSKTVSEAEKKLQNIPATDIILGSVGLVFGLVIAYLLSRVLIEIPYVGILVSIICYLLLGYLGVKVTTRKKEDFGSIVNVFKKVGKDKSHKNGTKVHPKLLDTSVIIDGRIADLCKTGFVEGPLVIPEFVLEELQHIADSSDALKRNRGRRGLDILNKIQKELDIEVIIHDKDFEDVAEVDSKLLKLAQHLGGKVVTNDYNLNKVAEFHGVDVLNINELANAIKPVVLPGEEMLVQVIKDGKESGQGVAYLDDGTMIVVDGGRNHIGQTIDVMVTSVLQTSAGRMIFAKPKTAVDKAV
ncbi:putative PIN and TRAM-domain containing protein YacL [Gottschalkia purinilytica]|uniref:Putative PIN and TRAM-domain containing protein YacL n=1 Tax=Gottschalkia purinilytica TaxID=1503 RepID=A0A0L0W8Y4_GOTPU|nr:PIN/TRAM domain-containing protein [Gottschalkia purinilytica]KNF07989.1 putative PIN and TRAM-domain containing protein YacL [Gottschalkia purinilytica]